MPLRRRRRRWGRGMACCMPLPRACIDSLPRYCMPPLYREAHLHTPDPPYAESSSSQSDCSCFEEEFCTVENCRNAPMCISTRPQFCPYGISHQIDGNTYRSPSDDRKYCRQLVEMDHPRERFRDRNATYNPQAASSSLPSPEFDRTTVRRFPGESRCRRGVATDSPSQNLSPLDIQRFAQTRLSDVMPQCMSRSPRLRSAAEFVPQVPTMHRPDISNSRAHAEDMFSPSARTPLTDSATGEREIVTQQSPICFNKASDQFDHEDRGNALLQDAGYRKVQCTKQEAGCCDMERKLSNHNSPLVGANGNSFLQFEPKVTSSRLDDLSQHGAMETSGKTPNICAPGPSTMGRTNQTHFDCGQPEVCPVEKSLYSTPTQKSTFDASKCSCRYPPSFKHLSCTGNISGSCNCED